MSTISWYVVPTAGSLGKDVDARYYPSTHSIVLLGDSSSSGHVVRHEMLHALGALPGHPALYFQDHCGGIVHCSTTCIADGGPPASPVDTTGPLIDPDLLDVTASLEPNVPTSGDSSWAALTVQVMNQYPYAVRVRLDPVFNTAASETFGFVITSCDPRTFYDAPVYDWIPGTHMALAPGEVRRRMFDIRGWGCSRGLVAYFNSDTILKRTVVPIPSGLRGARPTPQLPNLDIQSVSHGDSSGPLHSQRRRRGDPVLH